MWVLKKSEKFSNGLRKFSDNQRKSIPEVYDLCFLIVVLNVNYHMAFIIRRDTSSISLFSFHFVEACGKIWVHKMALIGSGLYFYSALTIYYTLIYFI